MKLHIVNEKDLSKVDDDYTIITSFKSFMELTKEDFDMVDEIQIGTYLLGLSCLFWLIDLDIKALGHIHFIIDVTDPMQSHYLHYFIHKYLHKFNKYYKDKLPPPEDS